MGRSYSEAWYYYGYLLPYLRLHMEGIIGNCVWYKDLLEYSLWEASVSLHLKIDKRFCGSTRYNIKSCRYFQEELREQMEVEHKIQMDTQNTSNLKQITALRMELQRAVELRKQKVSMQFFLTLYWHHNLWNMSCLVWCEKVNNR